MKLLLYRIKMFLTFIVVAYFTMAGLYVMTLIADYLRRIYFG